MPETAVAVDLGGTNLRVAAVTEHGEVLHRRSEPTEAASGPTVVAARISAMIEETAAAAGLAPTAPAGVAVPGPVDPHTGVVFFTPNLTGWRNFPLGDVVGQHSQRPVAFGNDGNCAALGEARFGAGVGSGDLIYVALGTGVGGGIISGGRLIEGVGGIGGEIGHVVIALDGPRCTCGSIGCLEAFDAGWAIARDARLVATTVDGAAIRRAAGDREIDASAVARAAREGDPAAVALLSRAGRALGAAIGAFVIIFNPELVVIGGCVASLGDTLLDHARQALPQHAFPEQRAHVRLESSRLGDDTALYGAAALAFQSITDVGNHRLKT